MPQIFSNNAVSVLASGIDAVQTTLTVASGDGALFALVDDEFALLTLAQAGTETSYEVVKQTGRVGDVLTIERAHEGVAAAWASGDKVELRITAGYLNGRVARLAETMYLYNRGD